MKKAKKVEKVHPMANVLGTVTDMETYKQQYQKQQRKFNKVKKEFKKYFPQEKIDILDSKVIEIESFKAKIEQQKTEIERDLNTDYFENNFEKYEWLIENGCQNQEDRKWLAEYIRSDEYKSIYGDD